MPRRLLFLALLLALAGCGTTAPPGPRAPAAEADTAGVYTYRSPSRDGTGKVYMGREIAQVMGHLGAAWLERPERERTELPERLVDSLRLAPDAVVADIGAGTGYFAFRIAERVPEGGVYAVDIQPEMLDIVEARAEAEGIANVITVQGDVDDPGLPPESIDLALIVDSYHEFSHPAEMVAGIVRALRPGGRVVLVEYRGDDPSVPIKPLHTMTEPQARRELEAAGLAWRATSDFLPSQLVLVFEKP